MAFLIENAGERKDKRDKKVYKVLKVFNPPINSDGAPPSLTIDRGS